MQRLIGLSSYHCVVLFWSFLLSNQLECQIFPWKHMGLSPVKNLTSVHKNYIRLLLPLLMWIQKRKEEMGETEENLTGKVLTYNQTCWILMLCLWKEEMGETEENFRAKGIDLQPKLLILMLCLWDMRNLLYIILLQGPEHWVFWMLTSKVCTKSKAAWRNAPISSKPLALCTKG